MQDNRIEIDYRQFIRNTWERRVKRGELLEFTSDEHHGVTPCDDRPFIPLDRTAEMVAEHYDLGPDYERYEAVGLQAADNGYIEPMRLTDAQTGEVVDGWRWASGEDYDRDEYGTWSMGHRIRYDRQRRAAR